MSKLCRICLLVITIMILHHSELHITEIYGNICCVFAAYAAYIWHIYICTTYLAKFRTFFHIFCLKKFCIF